MKMIKALILLLISSNIVLAEPLVPDGEVTNVVSTFYVFSTMKALREFLGDELDGDFSDTAGFSDCWRDRAQNIAYCSHYVVRPREVDGEYTLTIGHEVLHGMYGPDYHE